VTALSAIDLEAIRRALHEHRPKRHEPPARVSDRASVALILAGPPEDLQLCFILRAARESDHWSGQMAFPGGRAEARDAGAQAVAERETFEEVGLRLAGAELLGTLSDFPLRHPGFDDPGVVSPFVYYAGPEILALQPSDEAESAHWIPLRHLWTRENAMSVEIEFQGSKFALPGIRHGENVIWGLTLAILMSFAEVVARPLPIPPWPER
jgi:8-oxo-dGTP pyrophosphatase MutT (NUDIX family)